MDDDTRSLLASCTRFLQGDGPVSPAALLADIPSDVEPDRYGDGGVVAQLQDYVAGLLGKPAALFLPSGTMAQAAVLRIHADRRSSRTVLWHPACHLATHEGEAYSRVHGLVGRAVGEPDRLLMLEDLAHVAETPAAVLIELPQRDLGGAQPSWDDLVAQTSWARDRGAAAHLDGARLWESSAGYGRTPAEIAALFDTAYVSFYKGVGALPGCCVAGPADVIAELAEWRRRLGGTLYGLWPNAASALARLPRTLEEMPGRFEHAQAVGTALAGVDGVRVVPDPPQTPMMHLLLSVDADRYRANQRRLATEQGIWLWPEPMATVDPGVVRVELSVGVGTMGFTPDEAAATVAELLA